jgi:integral membrane protein
MVKLFRISGWLEGLSFLLLLFIAVPIKYIGGHPEVVQILGPIHGMLFIAYVVLSNMVAEELEWTTKIRLQAILASVLPAGTFVFERKYLLGK